MVRMTMVRKFTKSAAMLLVALLLLSVGSVQAKDLHDDEDMMDSYGYSYNFRDIRSSLKIPYETDADTQLYHVVASKDFAVKFGTKTIKIFKGDVLLMFDVPALQKSSRVAIVLEEAYLLEINRNNLKEDKDGGLYKSNAIDVETNSLTVIMSRFAPDKPSVGKYIFAEADLKSKRLGVFRRGTLLATGEIFDDKGYLAPFFPVSLPGDKTGYIYRGYAKEDGYPNGGISHFIIVY